MLGKRIASAAVLIPIVGVAVYFGGPALFALVLLVGLLAGYELLRMTRNTGLAPSYPFGLLFIGLLVIDAQWPHLHLLPGGLALFSLLPLVVVVFQGNAPGSLVNWALTIAGSIYVGSSIGHFVKLRALDRGLYWLILALLGTWVCDSAAYFVGRALGKHSFAPKISPKKTWEGALAGFVFGTIAVVLLARFMLDLSIGWGIFLGVLLVLAATIGDLAESVIKRQVGVKDSGALIPGHGGALDRVDSLLFVVPSVYYFVTILGHLFR